MSRIVTKTLPKKKIQNIEVLLENARDTIRFCFGNDDAEFRLNNALSDLEDLYERFMRDDYKTTEAVAAQQACLNASEDICMILSYLRKRHQ